MKIRTMPFYATLVIGTVAMLKLTTVAALAEVTDSKVAVTFSGGHDTDPKDHGRPVVLVAAALGVPV